MIDDFIKEVRKACLDLKGRHAPPSELERPSPAKLKTFCLKLLKTLAKEDRQIFFEFFNPLNEKIDLETSIKGFDLDKLEPVRNFMIGKTTKPGDHIAKLVAVLIDFQPRPYNKWREVRYGISNGNLGETSGDGLPSTIINDERVDITQTNGELGLEEKENAGNKAQKQLRRPKFKKIALYGIVIASALFTTHKLTKYFNHECMYWNGADYISIPCRDTIIQKPKIALDKAKMKNLRRITQLDTLTKENTLGKTWYTKINKDSIELYTAPGEHPINGKVLKPATDYILDKYVFSK